MQQRACNDNLEGSRGRFARLRRKSLRRSTLRVLTAMILSSLLSGAKRTRNNAARPGPGIAPLIQQDIVLCVPPWISQVQVGVTCCAHTGQPCIYP